MWPLAKQGTRDAEALPDDRKYLADKTDPLEGVTPAPIVFEWGIPFGSKSDDMPPLTVEMESHPNTRKQECC